MKTSSSKNGSSAVRDYVARAYVDEAKRKSLRRFTVNAGDVHKAMGLQNRVPQVCNALQSAKFLHENGVRLVDKKGPPSGLSTSVTLTYEFVETPAAEQPQHPLLALRGVLRDVFRELGGGENFIRAEREALSSALAEKSKRQ